MQAAYFLIRMSAVGDVLIAISLLRDLHSEGLRVVFVTQPQFLALLQMFPFIQEVGTINLERGTQNPWEYWKRDAQGQWKVASFRKEELSQEYVVDLQSTSRSRRALAILKGIIHPVKVTKVPKRSLQRIWEVSKGSLWPKYKAKLVTPLCVNQNSVYTLQRQSFFHQVPSWRSQLFLRREPLDWGSVTEMELPPRYISVFLGASGKLKIFPHEFWVRLIEVLEEKQNVPAPSTPVDIKPKAIVLLGGKDSGELADRISQSLAKADRSLPLFNATGKLSLSESMKALGNSDMIVSHDSFAAHLAAFTQCPIHILFAGTAAQLGFVPPAPNVFWHQSTTGCLPCTRHGSGECRFATHHCATDLDPRDIASQLSSHWEFSPQ